MSHYLVIQPLAEGDIDHIAGWLRERTQSGAGLWFKSLFRAIRTVRENPFAFGTAREKLAISFELRQHLFRTRYGGYYRIVYTVKDNDVIVLRIRGPGQPLLRADDLDLDS